jgi:hypothetical protein
MLFTLLCHYDFNCDYGIRELYGILMAEIMHVDESNNYQCNDKTYSIPITFASKEELLAKKAELLALVEWNKTVLIKV